MTARRLATDAKIALTRAGFIVTYTRWALIVRDDKNDNSITLSISHGTVDNASVEILLKYAK